MEKGKREKREEFHKDGRGESEKSTNEDLIDLEKLRLSQNFAETVGVKKKIITVPVRKPHRQSFV